MKIGSSRKQGEGKGEEKRLEQKRERLSKVKFVRRWAEVDMFRRRKKWMGGEARIS